MGSSTTYERVLHRTKGPLHVEMVSKEESNLLLLVILCDNADRSQILSALRKISAMKV